MSWNYPEIKPVDYKEIVQVNHVVDKSDYTVQVGDLISVRKFKAWDCFKIRDKQKDRRKITVQLLLSKEEKYANYIVRNQR